jgi:hypothetical protein
VRTATPTGTPIDPTVVPTPSADYAAIALASGNLRDDTAAVLRDGTPVELTCHEAAPWRRPSLEQMSEKFTFYRFGNGEHPYPGLYALYLSDVLYQEVPWANSANIEFYSMSGLNGGNDTSMAAPPLCPAHGPGPGAATGPQAIYFVGLRPLAVRDLDGHTAVVVEEAPGMLHKIEFERPLSMDKGVIEFLDRIDVVTPDGRLRFVQSGGERWQADARGDVEFVYVGTQVGRLPSDLPLPDPFDAYDGAAPEWLSIRPGLRPRNAMLGSLVEDPLHRADRMLFLPAGDPVP